MFKFIQSEVACLNLSSEGGSGDFLSADNEEELDWNVNSSILLLCPELANFMLLTLCLYGMYHGIDIRCGFITNNFITRTHQMFFSFTTVELVNCCQDLKAS